MKLLSAAKGRWITAAALLILSSIAAPAMAQAQSCNSNPKAIIGTPTQTVPESTGGIATIVALNGAPSTPDGTNAQQQPTFLWEQTGSTPTGITITLQNATSRVATFSAPDVSGPTALMFTLTVRCGTKTDTAPAVVNITNVVTNAAPTAVASVSPAMIFEGDLVTLDGSGSYDIDNAPMTSGLSYQWTQIGDNGLPVSGGIAFNQPATSAVVTFTAPNTPTGINGTTLKFRLTVSDGTLAGFTDKLVTVVWQNDPPFATIACPMDGIVVNEGGQVVLDGSGSFDNDDGIASYFWQQLNGTPDTGTTGTATSVLSFTAPSLSYNELGMLFFKLFVKDQTGDEAEAECAVSINDVTAPVISAQADIVAEAENAEGAEVDFTIYAQDAVVDESEYSIGHACVPPSGHLFPLGTLPALQTTTPVSCAADDGRGNHATRNFIVTVRDTTPPTFAVPGSYAVQATGSDGAVADYGVIATADVVDGPGEAVCAPASGGTFPLGTTKVSCNAGDARGNDADTQTFSLTVHDTIAPIVTPPADVTVEATGPLTVVDYGDATASDVVGVISLVGNAPADFRVGATTIIWTAKDAAGNTGTATSTVTVNDTTPPDVTVPGNVSGVEATSADGAAVNFAATATDLVDGDLVATCVPPSDSTFGLGTTMVNCTATDLANNAGQARFSVTVVDTTPPVIAARGDVLPVEATGASGATVSYASPATSDVVDGTGTATCAPLSGTTFDLGETTVTCNATDAARNRATPTSFKVRVVDTTPPVIAARGDILNVQATGPLGAAVSYARPATSDIVDGAGTASCTPAPGSTFALGLNTVTCNASDAARNAATSTTFTIGVVDTTPPVIAPRGDILDFEATGPLGAAVSYARPATSDIVDGAGTASCTPASGSTFALGLNTVTCNASDAARNAAASTTFTIGVVDTTRPIVFAPADVIREATGPRTVVAHGSATASDLVGVVIQSNDGPADFPLGTTTITWSATDAAGNTGLATTQVTVVDTTGPAFASYPSVINATASGNAQAAVSFDLPTATDLVDGPVAVTCDRASGSSFPAGSTTVNCSARDGRTPANASNMSFRVQVDFNWTGFFRPVDNWPVINLVQAGSAIPVKFNLGGNQGLAIFEAGSPASGKVACMAGYTEEITLSETVTAGGSSLQYDATTGQYNYVWKTEKAWASSCRVLQLTLKDGSVHKAVFQFKK